MFTPTARHRCQHSILTFSERVAGTLAWRSPHAAGSCSPCLAPSDLHWVSWEFDKVHLNVVSLRVSMGPCIGRDDPEQAPAARGDPRRQSRLVTSCWQLHRSNNGVPSMHAAPLQVVRADGHVERRLAGFECWLRPAVAASSAQDSCVGYAKALKVTACCYGCIPGPLPAAPART